MNHNNLSTRWTSTHQLPALPGFFSRLKTMQCTPKTLGANFAKLNDLAPLLPQFWTSTSGIEFEKRQDNLQVIAKATQVFSDKSIAIRLLRSMSWIVLGYGASQAMRLASNLILTRILFPEAFGLMALIGMITVGLNLFSDVGLAPSISQSKRGDDPDFLNTAWTIQVLRGFGLFAIAILISAPISQFYAQPDLATYLPIAALALISAGFEPTRIHTAQRHLLMGRVTTLDLLSQAIGIVVMIILAVLMQSVLALVIGGVIGALALLVLCHIFLPGPANRFRWERNAASELITFGKWIFLSTLCFFFSSQGDKAILGKFLSLQDLGIYNIGFFLASFPAILGLSVTSKVMIPAYREMKGSDDQRIRKLRFKLSAGLVGMLVFMAFAGPWLVSVLYDDRYLASGAVIVVLALSLIPQVLGLTYDQAALAAGDSRRFFIFSAIRSLLQVGFLLIGANSAGLLGAMIGIGVATTFSHFVLIWLARVHRVWDLRHDVVFAAIGFAAGGSAIWLHWESLTDMAQAIAK